MRSSTTLLAGLALCAASALPSEVAAQSTVIDFNNDGGFNPLTAFSQNGYFVKRTSGPLIITNNDSFFGDAVSTKVSTSTQSGDSSFDLSRLDNGQFSIESFVGGISSRESDDVVYSIRGYLGGVNTYSTGAGAEILPNNRVTFTISPLINVFDRVNFSIRGSFSSSAIVDDINVTSLATPTLPAPIGAVPEPATWAMMIFGFGMVGGAMRRRKSLVTTQVSYAA